MPDDRFPLTTVSAPLSDAQTLRSSTAARLRTTPPATPRSATGVKRVIRARPAEQRLRFAGIALATKSVDFLLLFAGFLFAAVAIGAGDHVRLAAPLMASALVALLSALGGYREEQLRDPWRQMGLLAVALLVAAAGFIIAAIADPASFSSADPASFDLAPAWLPALAITVLAPLHVLLAAQLCRWHAAGRFAEVTAVICEATTDIGAGIALARQIRNDPNQRLLGIYDVREGTRSRLIEGLQVRGGPAALRNDSRRRTVDRIIVTMSPERAASHGLLDMFAGMDCDISTGIEPHGTLLQRRPLTDAQIVRKEIFNRIVATIIFLLCLPTLALVALLIKLDSRGPVLFRQERTGYNDRRFTIYKFRTMHAHMEDPLADRQTTREDPRITRVGKIMRKLSIDELPQLLNVIRGDMALVGPRPHAPNTKAGGIFFDDVLDEYAQRHRVKPGITGWAQVNGWRGETQVPEQVRRRVEHDLYYIDHWSLWMDIRIIVLTVVREIFSKHAF